MKKSARFWVAVALCLCLLSGIGAYLVQTSGNTVQMTEVKWLTTYGYTIDAYLLIPENATVDTPAPGIVCSHGLLNNKEMQDLNYVELARRGYVVLAIDMLSHGDSAIVSDSNLKNASVYEGALFLNNLDIVDKTKIGITGHSAGGANSNLACSMDNENETQIISAALINSTDPTYKNDEGEFANIYGSRDVGVIAGQYDEFGFVTSYEDGTQRPTPEYINSVEAQSFLNFGKVGEDSEVREANVMYTDTVDGKECFRIIYNPSIIHPWAHFSKRATTATIEFFENALGAPNPIPASNQIWQWKVVFNVIGLVGFVMFIINAAIAFVDTKYFSCLKASEDAKPVIVSKRSSRAWFYISLLLCAAFGAATYLPILVAANSYPGGPSLLGQKAVYGVSMWALACGAFAAVCIIIGRLIAGKESKFDAAAVGLRMSPVKIFKTILLAIVVSASAYALVFLDDYFFHGDFRLWVLAVKAFEPIILRIAIPFMVIFCGYYVVNSIAINCFNFNDIGGKFNLAIQALFNAIPVVILILLQYVTFKVTGLPRYAATNGPLHLYLVWTFPLVAILPVSAVIARKIYVKTKNPYLPGIINAIIVALISCANTVSYL